MPSYVKLINCLQGKTVRWIEGSSPCNGLYTGGIETCRIVILFGKKGGKDAMSMIHFDQFSLFDVILNEKNWMDNILKATVSYKPSEHIGMEKKRHVDSFINNLLRHFPELEIEKIPARCGAIKATFLNSESEIHVLNSDTLSTKNITLMNHPDAPEIYSYYMLNTKFFFLQCYSTPVFEMSNLMAAATQLKEMDNNNFINEKLKKPFRHQQIIYDGKDFQKPLKHDLQFSNFLKECIYPLHDKASLKKVFGEKNMPSELVLLEIVFNNLCRLTKKPFIEMELVHRDHIKTCIEFDFFSYLADNFQTIDPGFLLLFQEILSDSYQRKIEMSFLRAGFRTEKFNPGFFSLSRYATEKQPYGPYRDLLCAGKTPELQDNESERPYSYFK
ncbi:MAG: hypothetical protein NTZ67_02830 [Gammaproteobacteria bacterium]|nr:hypothetical protein [Gammaproteobacteria bacterium]